MRHATACLECREAKRRCVASQKQKQCTVCARRQVSCSFDRDGIASAASVGPLHKSRQSHDAPPPASSNILDLYGRPFVEQAISLYLQLIHDRPHSLFHVKTLWNEYAAAQMKQPLLVSLCALGVRLSPDPHVRGTAGELTSLAKKALHACIEDISLQVVQASILLANICAAELEPSFETLYFGIAARMAHILKLNVRQADDHPVLQETKCRVWWALVMADNWCSAGLGIPRQLASQVDLTVLPNDEDAFQKLSPNVPSARLSSQPGLWAYMIQLVDVFGPILDLHQELLDNTIHEDSAFMKAQHIGRRLDDWSTNLPPRLQLNEGNLSAHRDRGLGGAFVALHLGFFHYSTLLYFRYLDERPGGDAVHREYGQRCRNSASAYSRLLLASRSETGCEAVYATVGHMTVVSSSVLIHTLLRGDESELADARTLLTTNFQALIELKKYWPCLEKTMGRLLDYQNACLVNDGDTDTHRVDEWMVRFLTEHSLPLDHRAQSVSTSRHPAGKVRSLAELEERKNLTSQALAQLWDDPTEGD